MAAKMASTTIAAASMAAAASSSVLPIRSRQPVPSIPATSSSRRREPPSSSRQLCPGLPTLRQKMASSSPRAQPTAAGAVRAVLEAVPSVQPAVGAERLRQARVVRKTKETSVEVVINVDGTGQCIADTGIPFLDHMLDQIASHGLFDVCVRATGDTHIDDHHTNEDIGLAFGQALAEALGDRKGIHRFGDFSAPLDEALIHVVLDLSGRPHLGWKVEIPTERVGTYDTQLVEHFFQSLVNTSGMTLHIRMLDGKNSHHIIEATFKAFARALRRATEVDPRRANTVPSSKGVLTQK